MNYKDFENVTTQEEARILAQIWQAKQRETAISYGELAEYQELFEALASKFDLITEFKENGII